MPQAGLGDASCSQQHSQDDQRPRFQSPRSESLQDLLGGVATATFDPKLLLLVHLLYALLLLLCQLNLPPPGLPALPRHDGQHAPTPGTCP